MRRWAVCVLVLAACNQPDPAGIVNAMRSDGSGAAPVAVQSTRCILSPQSSHYRPSGLYLAAVLPVPAGGIAHLWLDVRTPWAPAVTRALYVEAQGGTETFRSSQVTGNVRLFGTGPMNGQFHLVFVEGSRQRALDGTFYEIARAATGSDDAIDDGGDDGWFDDGGDSGGEIDPGDGTGDDSGGDHSGGDDSGGDSGGDSGSGDSGGDSGGPILRHPARVIPAAR